MNAQDLLAGPRGRRLCWELLSSVDFSVALVDLESAVGTCLDLLAVGGMQAQTFLLVGLRDSVGSARYWQDPDEDDVDLVTPGVAASLEPVAEAVTRCAESAWWSSTVPLERQVAVRSGSQLDRPAEHAPAIEGLRTWRTQTVLDNTRMKQHRAKKGEAKWAITSGIWWTQPHRWSTVTSTRLLEQLGPVSLWAEKDADFDKSARSSRVIPPPAARIYEVTDHLTWAELVTRYPCDVTYARGANWLQATGRDGAWLIPDWLAVANDYDGVHLTVEGYLTTSGRIVTIDPQTASFIAGWNPDETIWLTDVPTEAASTEWALDAHTDLWSKTPPPQG